MKLYKLLSVLLLVVTFCRLKYWGNNFIAFCFVQKHASLLVLKKPRMKKKVARNLVVCFFRVLNFFLKPKKSQQYASSSKFQFFKVFSRIQVFAELNTGHAVILLYIIRSVALKLIKFLISVFDNFSFMFKYNKMVFLSLVSLTVCCSSFQYFLRRIKLTFEKLCYIGNPC